jgi:7-cyano-7-deazaguanine synthase in queuosine biosynthesis
MNLDIPKTTPSGKPIKTIGVWMSGGADSSLLCYLLAETIKTNNLPISILPITIDYKRPFQNIAVKVKDKIAELLDAKNIFLDHIVYYPPENIIWTRDQLRDEFHVKNYENFKEERFQALFSGISTNPPIEVQETFQWGVLEDVELKRGVGVNKDTVRWFLKEEDGKMYEFLELKPFFNVNKQAIAKIYTDKNLNDTLFPLTRSCEKIGTVAGHCGECWWCEERKWGFGKL